MSKKSDQIKNEMINIKEEAVSIIEKWGKLTNIKNSPRLEEALELLEVIKKDSKPTEKNLDNDKSFKEELVSMYEEDEKRIKAQKKYRRKYNAIVKKAKGREDFHGVSKMINEQKEKFELKGFEEEEAKSLIEALNILIDTFSNPTTRQIKRGAFLGKQLIKHNYNKQLNLFDTLQSSTQAKILASSQSIEYINQKGEAVNFTGGHNKLIQAIVELLPKKSPNYEGNIEGLSIASYGGAKATGLVLTLYEIAKKYNASKNPSGRHIEIVTKLCRDIAHNPELLTLIRYERKTKTKEGTIKVSKIEEYAPLWRMLNTSFEEFNEEETKVLRKGSKVVLLLNPIFTDLIKTDFQLLPENMLKRSLESYGSNNPPDAYYRFINYLTEHRKLKNYKRPIKKELLLYTIDENAMRQKRKKRVEGHLEKSIEAALKLGILKSYEITKAKTTGEIMYIFYIQKDPY